MDDGRDYPTRKSHDSDPGSYDWLYPQDRTRGFRWILLFFFQAEDGIRDVAVTGVQTCALPISPPGPGAPPPLRCRAARAARSGGSGPPRSSACRTTHRRTAPTRGTRPRAGAARTPRVTESDTPARLAHRGAAVEWWPRRNTRRPAAPRAGPARSSSCRRPKARTRRRRPASLEVLQLLPEFLQFALHRDHRLRDRGVVGLRADRVDLAQHLLREEPELLANRPLLRERLAARGDVRAQPHQLLRDVHPVGEQGDLHCQALLVHAYARRELRHGLLQPLQLGPEPGRRPRLHAARQLRNGVEPARQIRRQGLSLARAHLQHLTRRLLDDR